MTETKELSECAEAEWHPNAEPPVYVVRTEEGHKMEVYLTPDEVEALGKFHRRCMNQ